MKLTKSQLKQLIKEEAEKLLDEGFGEGTPPKGEFYKKQVVVMEDEEELNEDASEYAALVPHLSDLAYFVKTFGLEAVMAAATAIASGTVLADRHFEKEKDLTR
jgi:coenzyme F420-reducing hydrogenase beta subunit